MGSCQNFSICSSLFTYFITDQPFLYTFQPSHLSLSCSSKVKARSIFNTLLLHLRIVPFSLSFLWHIVWPFKKWSLTLFYLIYLFCVLILVISAPFISQNLLIVIHSLLDLLGGVVQVSVADPLHLKPILEVVVSTAAKLHLQTIDCLLLKTAARHVCVLVEPNTIPQAHLTAGKRKKWSVWSFQKPFYWSVCQNAAVFALGWNLFFFFFFW